MFHAGDLNSGISLAIQQHKLVACLIRQAENPVSQQWEREWLTRRDHDAGATFGERLGAKAVVLRLDYGGKEAGFLAAFCEIEKAPTLVIIDQGRVLEKLEGGVGEEEWVRRVQGAVGLGGVAGEETAVAEEPSAQSQSPSTQSPSTLFPSRAAQHAASKAKLDAAAKAQHSARQTARKHEADEAHAATPSSAKGKGKQRAPSPDETAKQHRARATYLHQQTQRNHDAKKERDRILAQIEADKSERRLRAPRAKLADDDEAASSPLPPSRLATTHRTAGASASCALQIRLFDGSALRAHFPATATLAVHVRDWIRETCPPGSGGADVPYTFRQILAPRPSRAIDVVEEHGSLGEVAVVVLVPVAGYTAEAYAGSGSSLSAAAGGVLGYGYGLASSVWNLLPAGVSGFFAGREAVYLGGTGDASEEGANVAGARMAGVAGVRPPEEEREGAPAPQEFYNGNSLKFEERGGDREEEV
ncbi:hypothetical protein LTR08_003987 [Meristemomyces frigidus]|nr:hypothetical protein LTR08_003987 [Meristemomyces frigidus]